MGATYEELTKECYENEYSYIQSTNEHDEKFFNYALPSDFFALKFYDQLAHEAAVRKYVIDNKLSEVEYRGKKYKFDQNSFKVDFDFDSLEETCQVCD